MDFKEGDRVRHNLSPDMPLEVVRVDKDWMGDTVLVVRDRSTGHSTFKVEGWQVTKERNEK